MELTAAAIRILDAAIDFLAEDGVDASPLAVIAKRVVIRKPSLYAHFSNKDEPFQTAFTHAVEEEHELGETLISPERIPTGIASLENLRNRYDQSSSFRFLVRTAYSPPTVHAEFVRSAFAELSTAITNRYRAALQGSAINGPGAEQCVTPYDCLLDGLQVELIYGSPGNFSQRLNVSSQALGMCERELTAQ